MALRSVLDVEINDRAFRDFAKLYDRYAQSLKGMPAAWKLVNDKIDGSKTTFDKMVASLVATNVQEKLRLKAQQQADLLVRTQADRWRDIARSTKSAASHIRDATTALLKWSGIVGVVGGLIGAGGLYGIDRLALDVAGTRRSALGLGTGFGQQRAFSNFSRLVDPEAFLGAVAGAKFDITRRVGLIGAGLNEGELSGDTATTSVALLRHLKQIADTTNPALFAQVIQARRLGEFVGPQDLERLRSTSREEFAQLIAKYRQTRTTFDLRPGEARSVQDLSTQIINAWRDIETGFFRKVAQMSPALTHLSESFEKVTRDFLESPALGRWIGAVDTALEKFAKYIGTPEFDKQVSDFVTSIGQIADALGRAARWIASWFPAQQTNLPPGVRSRNPLGSDYPPGVNPNAYNWNRFTSGLKADWNYLFGGGVQSADAVSGGLMQRGFTRLQAAAITGNLAAESRLDPGAVNSTSGAFGLEQLLGARKQAFLRYAAATGRSPNDVSAQLDWIRLESTGGSVKYGGSDERDAYRKALGGTDLKAMTAGFGRYVERPSPADLSGSMDKRQSAATAAYQAPPPAAQSSYATSGRTVVTIDHSVGGNPIYSVNALKN